jgi:PAS domain S-box-containing protein
MRLLPRIIILLVLMTLISGALVKYQVDRQKRMVALYTDQVLEQKKLLVRQLTEVNGDFYKSLVFDYTFWDDMIGFIQRPDTAWATENIYNLVEVYKATAVWIYNMAGDRVYATGEITSGASPVEGVLTPVINEILARDRFIRFYIPLDSGLLEIHGATVHPTADPKRLTEPRGFLFVGKLWDRAYIKKLEEYSDCFISLANKPQERQIGKGVNTLLIPLLNPWQKEPVSWLVIGKDLSTITEISTFFDRNFYMFLISTSVGLVVCIFLLMQWIVIPLRKVSRLLARQNLSSYNLKGKSTNEFTEIRGMVEEFILQQKALAESEEKFRRLAESTSASIFIHDGERVLFSNPATELITGYTEEELKTVTVAQLIHPEYRDLVMDRIKNFSVDPEKPRHYELKFLFRDGTFRWADITSVFIGSEKERRFLVTGHDITERINMEHDLIVSKEKAEESDKLKTAFLNNLSHEIRTPMNSIVGLSAMLRRRDISREEVEEFTERISYSTGRLLRLIEDILEMSRIETGELPLSPVEFRPDHLMEKLVAHFNQEKLIHNKTDVTIRFVPPVHDPGGSIIADPERLKQVLSYLMDNALKFTRKGTILVGYQHDQGGMLKFYVSDTGIGIDGKDHGDIFRNFYQVEYSNARRFGGTGLGLPISKAIVKLMGGEIWFDSAKDEGTTFYFTVPLKPRG